MDRNQHRLPAVAAGVMLPLLVLCLPSPHLSSTQTECNSLLSFLANLTATSQAALSSWGATGDPDCCRWDGVTCDGNGSIAALSLPSKGLQGMISPALGELPRLARLNLSHNSLFGKADLALLMSPSLEVLDLSFNSLSGPLPSLLPSLLRLKALNISSNRFNGSFPPLWVGLQGLQALNCSNNSFSGSIPSLICSVSPQLESLDLSFNELEGNVPDGLGDCSKLRVFRAGYNNLTGEIPSDLYDAVSLQLLSLPSNHLSGELDSGRITNLTNLTLLDLSTNMLDGMLPDSIGRLTKLERLVLNTNSLTGPLPPSLHNCTRLRYVILRQNNLSGELSAVDFSSLVDLDTLDLGINNFTGSLPASIYSCRSLAALRLARNPLEGQIAPDLVKLRALSFLSLSATKLHNISAALQILARCENLTVVFLTKIFIGESMPDDVLGLREGFVNLRVLDLANSQLTGTVPSWISKLHKLEYLDLSSNNLTGPLPVWLGNLPHLFYLVLSHNKFDPGIIPLELTNMSMLTSKQPAAWVNQSPLPLPVFIFHQKTPWLLQYNQLNNLPAAIYLSDTSLEGAIPPEIGQLVMLQVLDLSQNNLSGEIPAQIGRLANLQKLVLSENHLSGNIPQELARLNFLSSFNVSHNNLSGPIPVGGQFDILASSSFEGNPGLCGMAVVQPCELGSAMKQLPEGKRIDKEFLTGFLVGIGFGEALVFILVYFFYAVIEKGRDAQIRYTQ